MFNAAIAFSFLTHKNAYQFVCVELKGPEKCPSEVYMSLQELGLCHSSGVQNVEVKLPDIFKFTDP
jgi:hypothetical protein